MKFIVSILLTALLSFAIGFYMSWWSLALASFLVALFIIASGATPRLISKHFSFTEGPAVDNECNIFFPDQPNN